MLLSHIDSFNNAFFYYPDPHKHSVHVLGDFNGWQTPGIPMQRQDKGWHLKLENIPFNELSYKFLADGEWVNDPCNVLRSFDGYGSENSVIYNHKDRGNVYHFDFYSPSIQQTRGYTIYLPPDYFKPDKHFSALYLLHGALDWEYTWVHKGRINLTLDRLKKSGKIGDMIVIMPRENGEFFRGEDMYADYIYKDLVGHIDVEFKTIPHPKHRAIDGLSTGAFSSIVIGASHPYIFSSIAGMSGSYDSRTFDAIQYNLDLIKRNGPRFYISCGQADPSCEVSGRLAQLIRSHGIECEFYANPGPHDWEFWGPSVAGNLEFHWWNFQKKQK